jgi:hypothetical protein
LIFGFCRQHGLQDTNAADVAQQVMRAVAGAMGDFNWLQRKDSKLAESYFNYRMGRISG